MDCIKKIGNEEDGEGHDFIAAYASQLPVFRLDGKLYEIYERYIWVHEEEKVVEDPLTVHRFPLSQINKGLEEAILFWEQKINCWPQ